ncbi:hypothetical protein [Antribacter gilvus]|uniref:hypothetical protein n=1 Tax=Antribacter gilvus TaxID=2304675 RepID=UPI001F0BA07F|nr:hypothetical protein [Antribacter gilvus]
MDDLTLGPDELGPDGLGYDPDEAPDDVDVAVLAAVARIANLVDPVPAGLVERAQFAATLASLECELMELSYIEAPLTGVRGSDSLSGMAGDAAPVEARTITFTHDTLTVMISLSGADGGRVRVDGWAAPSGALTVELLRPGAEALSVESDEDGRFAFESVDRGPASLVVRRSEAEGAGAVSTPVIEL